mmetsp:Transcript_75991/g.170421  ORF Transcript_75991/g.170421 Transcript_75991/m.170421 type:complete len:203 (+) Transcript_75991:215-823(+)
MILKLIHHRAIAQPSHILLQSLHTSRCHLHHFLRVQTGEALPHVDPVKLFHKFGASLGCPEVDEAVPNVALVLEINWQVHEVEDSTELNAQLLDEHLSGVLVGNVPQHHSGVVRGRLTILATGNCACRLLLHCSPAAPAARRCHCPASTSPFCRLAAAAATALPLGSLLLIAFAALASTTLLRCSLYVAVRDLGHDAALVLK